MNSFHNGSFGSQSRLGDCLSSRADLWFGVSRGLVLGPLLLTLCATPLGRMVCEHSVPRRLCADDGRLCVSFASGDSAAALDGLRSCLASVQSWLSTGRLTLSPDKTQFLLAGNGRQRSRWSLCFRLSFSVSRLALLDLLAVLV